MPDRALRLIRSAAPPRSAEGLASAVARLVSAGKLAPGQRLPTVRATAREMKLSPTTVSDAWHSLVASGVIETHGRLGTFVRDPAGRGGRERFWQIYPADASPSGLDLSEGVPDPELLPPIGPALASLSALPTASSYLDDPVVAELESHLRATWPFEPQRLTVVDGALDAIDRLCSVLVRPGDRVVVEDPGFPPLFDLLDLARADTVGVAVDDEGMDPEGLAAALRAPTRCVVFLQPRGQNPTGACVSAGRAAELAAVIERGDALVVEDDHSGEVAAAELHTVGRHIPERTLLVRSFSKSHGPDLRLAAIGGSAGPIDALVHRRQLGPAWSSRLLQEVLLAMLVDPETDRILARARQTYDDRRSAIADGLAARGVTCRTGRGINLWMDVADEQAALVDLAARGIGVAPGRPFLLDGAEGAHLRVTTGMVRKQHRELAEALADAATRRSRGRT